MLGVGISLVLVVFIMIALGVLGSVLSTQRQVNELFRNIATRMDGRVIGPQSLPTVEFNKNGVVFVVRGRVLKGKSTLTIYSIWPEPGFRAKLFPETISDAMKTFIGMQDIKVGNPKFDARFVVQSNDKHRLLEILQPDAQAAIFSLGKEAVLNINGAKIQLERHIDLSDRVGVNKVIHLFMDAYFVLTKSALDLSGSLQVTAVSFSVEKSVCMICGEAVVERRVQCRRCQTPHHQECWEYLGQCSTYGCGATKWNLGRKTPKLRIR